MIAMGTKARFIPLLFLLFVTLWLRLANLGYSDYQGDELKALASPAAGQSLFDFLLEQKKGPTQFIASALIRLAHPTLENQFVTRLPFAVAGIAAVYIFYRLVASHFGQRIAVMATLLLSINGLLVGLARIVQYQSFVILFSLLALYCFSLALQEQRWKILGIYAGMLCWAGAILSHFDGIFIAPFALYLLACWYRATPGLPAGRRLKHLLLPAALAAMLLAAFYIPYLTSLRASTQQYWWLRISGEESEAGLPSSLFTFTLYNPLLAIYLYIGLGVMSLFKLRQVYPILLWFAFPWLILERIVADPGTHIYTYLIPATILVAVGVDVCAELLGRLVGERLSRVSVYAGFGVAVLFLSAVSHLIFIDHTPEYPWEARRVLNWTIGKPDMQYRLWVFGFPYYRRWEEIGAALAESPGNGYYSTNESKSIARYFIPDQFDVNRSGYYIHIYYPQSFRDRLADDKIRYWTKKYPPVKTFEYHGKVVAEIYEMPPGGVDEIKREGY